MLEFSRTHWLQMLATAWDVYPLEGCGLLVGQSGGDSVERFIPIRNEAESSRFFRLDGSQYVKAALAADDDGLDIIGVMHSHTHTAAYPSPTDVAEASKSLVPSNWHWVIVGLGFGFPELRSFRIGVMGDLSGLASEVDEEQVRLKSEA